jgi:hypothetical protein
LAPARVLKNLPAVHSKAYLQHGEPLWLSGKVVKNEKINEIKRTWVRSPPRATSLKKKKKKRKKAYLPH